MLQIKDVPADVHRVLKARAALEGISLTEPVDAGESAADALAHVRDDLA